MNEAIDLIKELNPIRKIYSNPVTNLYRGSESIDNWMQSYAFYNKLIIISYGGKTIKIEVVKLRNVVKYKSSNNFIFWADY